MERTRPDPECLTKQEIEALARLGSLTSQSNAAMRHLQTCERCRSLFDSAVDGPRATASSRLERSAAEQTQETPGRLASFGNYHVLQRVGTGGMGEVYLAEQVAPIRRKVALKIIKRGMDTERVVARFESERQALAVMNHPCIAKVFDAGQTPNGRPYFVMEYVPGVSISSYCDKQRLSTRERLELFIQLCEGVQHAHQKGIIHRDLKPSNVLVTVQEPRPLPKIIDFGVAKATQQKLTEQTMYTRLGELIGTPEYMSPEQAEMTIDDVDTRTDVYSLGVILYELLAGTLPFESDQLRRSGFDGIVRTIRELDFPRPSTRVNSSADRLTDVAAARRTLPDKLGRVLAGDLDWITMKALEKDRTRRYGSAQELAIDLRRHLRHEPVLAGPPSATYRARKFVRRHSVGVGIAMAAVLGLLGFAVTMTIQANRIARERDRANHEAATSKRVAEFLVGVFNMFDPGEARGTSITAREVLDRGAAKMQRELKDRPLLRAKMMDTMGRVYQNLGLYGRAESLLVGALELREAQLGAQHLLSVESLSRLGWLRFWQGRMDEARAMHTRALSLRERALGHEHVDTAWSLYHLGVTEVMTGNGSKGRLLLERAMPIFERAQERQAVAWCLNDIGLSYDGMGDYASALPYYERALRAKTIALGSDHHDVGLAQLNVGSTLMHLGRLAESQPYLEAAVTIIENSLGPNHTQFAHALSSLGDFLRRRGDYEGARAHLLRALQILEASVGEEHWAYPWVLHDMALLAHDTQRYDDADTLFLRALRNWETQVGSEHGSVAMALENRATLLRAMDRADEALTLEARAKTIRAKLKEQSSAN